MGFSRFFFEEGLRTFRNRRSQLGQLVVVLTAASTGGIIAYADSSPPQQTQIPVPKKKLIVLGTGWAGTSFLKSLDSSLYDVKVISPRNYFAFTPLLPSVTCGTVEARSIVEPIRKIVKKKTEPIKFIEAECFKVDLLDKKVHCQSKC